MKKLIIIIVFLITITGCNNNKELNNTYIVKTLMIDYQSKEYIVKANIIKNNKNDTTNIEIKCNNLNNMIKEIKKKYYKNINLNHLNLIILTKDSINNKFKDITKYLYNNKEIKYNSYIAITNNKNIKLNNQYNKLKTIENEYSTIKNIKLYNLLNNIYKYNKTYIPDIDKNGIYIIDNNKIIHKLNEEETTIYNILNNNIKRCYIDNKIIDYNKTIIIKNKKINIILITKTNNKNNFKKLITKKIKLFNDKYKLYNKELNINVMVINNEKY